MQKMSLCSSFKFWCSKKIHLTWNQPFKLSFLHNFICCITSNNVYIRERGKVWNDDVSQYDLVWSALVQVTSLRQYWRPAEVSRENRSQQSRLCCEGMTGRESARVELVSVWKGRVESLEQWHRPVSTLGHQHQFLSPLQWSTISTNINKYYL